MRIDCQNCGQHYDIPEEKIPEADQVKFTCPKCGGKNRVDLREFRLAGSKDNDGTEENIREDLPEQLEEERFPLGSYTALFFGCESSWQERCKKYLQDKGYYINIIDDVHEARKKLRVHTYQVIILEDIPETESLLKEVDKWPGTTRRGVNCLLVGPQEISGDSIYAFKQGVNGYLSYSSDQRIEELLEQALSEHDFFYQPWKRAQEMENRTDI